jgi:preprotein translocase subunit SecE
MWGFESLLPCQTEPETEGARGVMAWHAERLKNQEMSGGATESRAGALWERVKEHPQRWRGFLHEVRVEIRQVTWPSQHEVAVTTFVVIVAVAFFGLYFFGVDSTVGYLLTRLFNLFKH